MPAAARTSAVTAIGVGLRWRGALDARFVSRVLGRSGTAALPVLALSDPIGWARRVLGIAPDTALSRSTVQRRFREALRDAHPDHGGEQAGAADRIADLAEARRILLS